MAIQRMDHVGIVTSYRLCHLCGPVGIIVELAEKLG